MATKLYRNTSSQTLNVLGVGEIEPGEQVSLSGQYLPVVIMENYPGLVDATDEEVAGTLVAKNQPEDRPQEVKQPDQVKPKPESTEV